MKLRTLTIDRAYTYRNESLRALKAEVVLTEDDDSEMKIKLSSATIVKIINLIAAEVQTNAARMARGVGEGMKESAKLQIEAANSVIAIEN
jgi:lipase chaperone LimK